MADGGVREGDGGQGKGPGATPSRRPLWSSRAGGADAEQEEGGRRRDARRRSRAEVRRMAAWACGSVAERLLSPSLPYELRHENLKRRKYVLRYKDS